MKPAKSKKTLKPVLVTQQETLNNRLKLREYCQQNSITTPDFFAAEDFAKISFWAMKKNLFPLCIKTAKNFSNNQYIYILKAFRELPEFFEKIQNKSGEKLVIIEDFIDGKANLEVTLYKGQVRLISQFGLSKAMKLQTKWRAFPIKMPDGIFGKIQSIIGHFNELVENAKEPIRFSFVMKGSEPILLAINEGSNRKEYEDSWREIGKLEPFEESKYPASTKSISKINIYSGIKVPDLDFSKVESLCEESRIKLWVEGKKLYLMLSSESALGLKEDFQKVEAMVKQIIDSQDQ